ncbi:hypothetical protein CRG98_044155, partial [Punica granatum]
MRANQRAKGHASILAIGTATPESCFHQADFPDYYFRVTKSEHMTVLKQKFTRICCFAGGTVLRIAKDLAENNANARVLVVNAESIIGDFRGPSEENMASLVLQAIFGDGAAALIIGADPIDQ